MDLFRRSMEPVDKCMRKDEVVVYGTVVQVAILIDESNEKVQDYFY
jgi:hypothetical protein